MMATAIAPSDLPLAPLMRRDATPDEKVVWYAAGALYRFGDNAGWDTTAAGLEDLDDEDWAIVAARVGIATITPAQRAATIAAIVEERDEQARWDEGRSA